MGLVTLICPSGPPYNGDEGTVDVAEQETCLGGWKQEAEAGINVGEIARRTFPLHCLKYF